MITIKVAEDFSDVLGGRFRTDGDYSGEEFYETLLCRKFDTAVKNKEKLLIDLDGTFGYPSSFIDQSFGELSRRFGSNIVLKFIELKSEDQPSLIDDIVKNIKGE